MGALYNGRMSRFPGAAVSCLRLGSCLDMHRRGWSSFALTLLLVLGVLGTLATPAQAQRARDPAHPFTIVVLSPAPTGTAGDAARVILEQAARGRGLPISVVPLAATDASGAPVSDDALLRNARQLGGEAVLIGRVDAAAGAAGGAAAANQNPGANPGAGAVWQWRLLTGYSAANFSGSLEQGIQGAADAFARASAGQSGPAVSVGVTVESVANLVDYARVSQLLANLPAVQSAGLVSADGATARFQLLVRGGEAAVTAALAGSTHLAPVQSEAGLYFVYHP